MIMINTSCGQEWWLPTSGASGRFSQKLPNYEKNMFLAFQVILRFTIHNINEKPIQNSFFHWEKISQHISECFEENCGFKYGQNVHTVTCNKSGPFYITLSISNLTWKQYTYLT